MEAETAELISFLQEGRCELAFIRDTMEGEGKDLTLGREFAMVPYCEDRLAVLLPKAHRLAGGRALTLMELSREPLILLKEKTFLHEMCMNACGKAGFQPNVVFSSHRIENIADLVGRGMGIGLLMERQLSGLDAGKFSVIPIEPALTSRISLIYLKNRPLSSAEQHFLSYAMQR